MKTIIEQTKDWNRFRETLKEFLIIQENLTYLGAGDTEPDGVWQNCLVRLWEKRDFEIPECAYNWELYVDEPGAEEAAQVLTKKLLEVIQSFSIVLETGLTEEQIKIVKSLCWRCFIFSK